MATKQKIEEWVKHFKNENTEEAKRQFGGLPIVNMMIAMDGPGESMQAIPVAGEWMTDDELETFGHLLMEEGPWVAGNAITGPCESILQFVKDYGIKDYGVDEIDADAEETYGTTGMSDKEAILHVLKKNTSWGEFIGGCVANVATWLKEDPQWGAKIRRACIEAIEAAEKHGVDH